MFKKIIEFMYFYLLARYLRHCLFASYIRIYSTQTMLLQLCQHILIEIIIFEILKARLIC